jgi:acetylornithine deacetylase/succinyl-diaminopimelate desuccinylase-like protein
MADPIDLAQAVAELVRVPSVNPLQCDDAAITGERRLAEHLAERASDLGATVDLDPVIGDRPNLVASFEGERPDVLVIDVHLDTVAVDHMTRDPFDGAIDDGRVYGRGAVDTKATFALVLQVLAELNASGRRPGPSVMLVGTVSEEIGGLPGARHLAARVAASGQRVDRMIVAEPTVCAPVHGHRGGVGLEVCLHGHAAHSSQPHLGSNAISAAARVIAAVDAEQARLARNDAGLALGGGSVSVTEIRGGVARNIIPDRCNLYAGRRLAPGEDPSIEFQHLADLIASAARPCSADVTMAGGRGFPAFLTDPADPFIVELASLSGNQPETASYGSNCAAYDAIHVPKVLFGPGSIDQAHQAVEWVEIDQLVQAADVYRRLLSPT